MSNEITGIKSFADLYSPEEIADALKDWGVNAGKLAEINATVIGMLRDGINEDSACGIQFRMIEAEEPGHMIVVDNHNVWVAGGWIS